MIGFNTKKQNQKGSLLIEAMAMLGLIAMVTPMLYRKAAERTSELQDINAAGQMRVLANAVDTYLRDNYDKIVTNQEVTSNCTGADKKKYNFSGNDSNDDIPVAHLCEYLPYGFSEQTMMFTDIKIAVKRRNFTTGTSVTRQDLSAMIVATPASGSNMQRVRASRIASMIGTNGGFADNKVGYGVQGVWKIDLDEFDSTNFKPSNAINNSLLATSIEAIATGNHGREDVLHRNKVDDAGVMNTMNTTLYLGNHPIKDVQQMIVTGNGLGTKDEAVLLENGTGINIESGKLHVGGDTDLDGTLNVDDDATFKQDVSITGHLSAATAGIAGLLTAGSAQIAGALDVTGDTALHGTLTVDKATSLKDTLTVADGKATTLGGDLTVEGTSALQKKVTIGTATGTLGTMGEPILEVKGDAKFNEDVSIAGTAEVDNLNVKKVFQAGSDGEYNLYVSKDKVDILKNNFIVGSPTTASENTGFLITETLTRMKNGTKIELESPSILIGYKGNADALTVVENDGVAVNQETFLVRDADSNTLFEVNQSNKEVRVKGGADFIVRAKGTTTGGTTTGDDLIFQVDQDGAYQTAARGASVYVRKGVVELGRNTAADKSTDKSTYTGYIKLDRIVGNQAIEDDAFHANDATNGYAPVKYDEYQVNPAYTSVMHDIKLTTRGGARLSDILPDFINKGIYVLDGTYKEKLNGSSVNWDTDASGNPVASNQFPYDTSKITAGNNVASAIIAGSCTEGDLTCASTPWLGFIPAPSCPPGYLKVATLNPIRWAMSEAGMPVKSLRSGADADEIQFAFNRDPAQVKYGTGGVAEPWKKAYTFQKSTWLNTSLKAFTKGGISYGWSGIIGFIYSAKDYATYLRAIGELPASVDNSTIVWNLFEVYNQQIVGIANVYCYFNRRSQAQLTAAGSTASPDFANDTLIDRYDQLTKVRVKYNEKDSAYVDRLNDPKLKYNDPW